MAQEKNWSYGKSRSENFDSNMQVTFLLTIRKKSRNFFKIFFKLLVISISIQIFVEYCGVYAPIVYLKRGTIALNIFGNSIVHLTLDPLTAEMTWYNVVLPKLLDFTFRGRFTIGYIDFGRIITVKNHTMRNILF